MSAHLARARLLLAQSRPADAERETMLALATQPQDPDALALLALSRLEQNKRVEALAAAREAVGLAPDNAHLHYIHALVLHRSERDPEARPEAQEALRLDPGDPDIFVLLASIELAQRNWPAALAAAEQALALDPEHVNAANLRSMALVRLGRKSEAMATVDHALHRAPENAFSHANQGWNCLHRNDPKRAQDHFREALRLEPDLEYAREGMLEALKARNPVYRGMLAYFLWMGRLGARYQWALIVGLYFGGQVLVDLARSSSPYRWLWWLLLGLFCGFVYLTWTAQPMFNFLLRFNRFGRHVLSRDQRVATNWFGPFFIAALAAVAWFVATDSLVALCTAYFLAILSIGVAATFMRRGRSRTILASATGLLALVAIAAMIPGANGEVPNAFASLFVYGFIGFQLLANGLATR